MNSVQRCTYVLVDWENNCQHFARDSANLHQPQNVRVILYYQNKFKPSRKRMADWIEHKHPTAHRGKNAVDNTILDDAEGYYRGHNVLIICGGDKGYKKQLGRFSTILLLENGNKLCLWQVLKELQNYFPPTAIELLNKRLLDALQNELLEKEALIVENSNLNKELEKKEALIVKNSNLNKELEKKEALNRELLEANKSNLFPMPIKLEVSVY